VGEFASGITTIVFNMLILKFAGNIGVAAYGVVANASMVAVAIFNGVSQGSQPLLSDYYGKGERDKSRKIIKLAIATSIVLAVIIIVAMYFGAGVVTAIFNGENNQEFTAYAVHGIRLYFTGFLFAGFNIVGTGILSATESAKSAFIASITRGFVAIIGCAFILSFIFGLDGVWLAFPTAEFITAVIVIGGLRNVG
jgi:Na+-driven multidrug efflux pump